jgi:putative drug exporter of the RND superfamily
VSRRHHTTVDPSHPRPTPPTAAQLGLLGRIGRGVSRHHRWVAVAWLLLVIVAGWLNAADKKDISDDFRIPSTGSQSAYDLLQERFTSQNAATATVVFSAPEGQQLTDPGNAATVAAVTAALSKVDGVQAVADPLTTNPATAISQYAGGLAPPEAAAVNALAKNLPPTLSADGRVAYANITFDKSLPDLLEAYPPNEEKEASAYPNPYSALTDAIASVQTGDVQVNVGGTVANTYNTPVSWWANHADEVGLGIGAILLLVAFGSLFGMAIPIATALFGAVTASGFVYMLASVTTVSSAAPPVTLMISIGVGLDYSLLIVTRYRQFLADGHDHHDAAGLAAASAGKAALFAGLTVCIALLGLWLVPIPLVQTLGLSAAIGVAVMILAAMTLLPTLLGFAGNKIDRFRLPSKHRDEPVDPERSFWGRFARTMARRPWFTMIGGTIVLLALAMPFLRIEFGMPDDSSLPAGLSQRAAFEQMQDGFGKGVNGPLLVVVGIPQDQQGAYTDVLPKLAVVDKAVGALQPAGTVTNVQYSVGPIPNSASTTTAVIYEVIPQTSPDDPATRDLVDQLRSDLDQATAGTGLQAYVGGQTATLIDLTDLVKTYLPIVIGAVVLGAFILLVLVFRSILVPLKAAIMNLISIGAAYGVVVMVFQWGWGKGAVGLSTTIPIVSFVPLVMFVILFGLSMDYEVFLMSRIREEWDRTGDPRTSVVLGVANTARVITTAALIMIAVFASFVTNQNPTVKLIGFGMAVAVLIDSTIVRMILVPAVMELLGKSAWWFPKWLEWLPKLDVEGPPDLGAVEAGGQPDPPAPEAEPVGAGV